jgi:hypothetical protein
MSLKSLARRAWGAYIHETRRARLRFKKSVVGYGGAAVD